MISARTKNIIIGASCFALASLVVQAGSGSVSMTPSLVGIADGADKSLVAHVANGQLQVGGTVAIANLPAQQTITGTVNVANLPATQQVAVKSMPSIEQIVLSVDVIELAGTLGTYGAFHAGNTNTTYVVPSGKSLVVDLVSVTAVTDTMPSSPPYAALAIYYSSQINPYVSVPLTPVAGNEYVAGTVQWSIVLPAGGHFELSAGRRDASSAMSAYGTIIAHLVDAPLPVAL